MKLLTANEAPGVFPPSYYAATAEIKQRPRLETSLKVDVCVVGAGYTGLSAALHLARKGMQVAVLDAHRVGWGASGRNGGQLSSGQRQDQFALEERYGPDTARAMWEISVESVSLVKDLISEYQIDCDLKPGIIHANHRRRFDGDTMRLVEHMNKRYGCSWEFLSRNDISSEIHSRKYCSGVLDLDAYHLHPLKYAQGLARACETEGVQIYELSEVKDFSSEGRVVCVTPEGEIISNSLVLACNGYLDQLAPPVARRVMPINNFIIATEPLSQGERDSLLKNDYAVADSKFVVNYFRFSSDNRMLFGGRESYGYKFPSDIREFVKKAMHGIFPQTKGLKVDYGWGGTLAITMSRLPFLQEISPAVYSASGYSGHGVGMATMSGKIIAEAITGDVRHFDTMCKAETPVFPGGVAFRHPLLVAAMLWYSLRDRI